ncbi:MAG TPA: STAS domain-containing protein [Thermoleophilaceae bacterium]|nr:STAS domain-containing protein [Thermoleophilaceae bacterium]
MNQDLIRVQIEQREDDVVVARLTGELDISVAEKTGRQIADAVPSPALGVVVDMSELEFMDSSGVSMLFSLARQVGSHRQQLRVVAPPGRPVSRVLQIVEFGRAAPVDDDVDSAVAEIATQRASQPPRG